MVLETLMTQDNFSTARKAMIDCQLRTSGVTAPFVIKRMGNVARESFVPEQAQCAAYADRAIALEDGHHLGAPLVQGMMLQEAAPKTDETAILVDSGSGYMAELLKPMVASLTVISPEEAQKSSRGKKADLLIIDGAVEHIPDALAKRLADDGRVITGIMDNGISCLACGKKTATGIALMHLAEIGIPALPEFAKPKEWSF